MGLVNVPVRAILALPVATPLSGRLMLAFLTGRRTGRTYRQPLSYVRDGDSLLTPGGGKWRLNVRDGEPVQVRLRGRAVITRPEIIGDLDEVQRLLGIMSAANPTVGTFVGIARGPDGRFDRARLQAAVYHGFRVVRWRLNGA